MVRKWIKLGLEEGIIVSSQSPWRSIVFRVKKPSVAWMETGLNVSGA